MYKRQVNINISYKKSLVPNQDVLIKITNVVYHNKSMVVTQEIRDLASNTLCSSAEVTFVLLNSTTGKPETISEEIIAKFDALEALTHV